MSRRTQFRSTALLPPVGLSPEEAAAVAVALAAQPVGPYEAAGQSALAKVLSALEPDAQRRAELLATTRWVGADLTVAAELRETLEHAVTEREVIALSYRDGRGQTTWREVEPQLLVRGSRHWFVVAWCRERQAPRWFREDRIESVEVTGETAPRRDPILFGAPSDTHPAGRALGRGAATRRATAPAELPRLTVLRGGREA